MRSEKRSLLPTAILCALMLAATAPAPAQVNLAGKSVQMIIGFGSGGGYDLWARTVGRHIGSHLPGRPNALPQNMPGAARYPAPTYPFNAAPRHATALATTPPPPPPPP